MLWSGLVWSTLTVTLPYPTLWCLLCYAQLSSAQLCSALL